MNPEVVKQILAIQETALYDERYNALLDEHEILNQRFLAALPTMSQEQQDAVMDYLGLVFAMHLRLLEIACE